METAARQHSEESAAKATARVERESASQEQTRPDFPNALMRLHRTHGNHFVQRMIRAGVVRAKLKISEPGDQYEQEADRVAERVMRMPAGESEEEETLGPAKHEQVQRACAPCEEEQKIQRMCSGCEDEQKVQRLAADEEEETVQRLASAPGQLQRQAAEEEDVPASLDELDAPLASGVQRKASRADAVARSADGGGHAPRSDSLDEGALQSGGQPMPDSVRTFYEDRFGRDFGDVKVHTGAESERANEDVSAYAFTYGNHVWLGRGQSVEPSFLLAHELAHVVQQKQPPLMRKARKAKSSSRGRGKADSAGDKDAGQSQTTGGELQVQRFIPYWEPYDFGGTDTHAMVLPEMGKKNNIFTEAPVPNADKIGDGYGKKGIADLYDASTTVGLFFLEHQKPLPLPSDRKLQKGGAKFAHKTSAAPKLTITGSIEDVDTAPKEIKVGDLKPTNISIEALLGTGQLDNYIKGYKLAQKEVDETPSAKPAGAKWGPLSARTFTKTELAVPDQFVYPDTGNKQASQKLVLKNMSKVVYNPKPQVTGKLFVAADPSRAGIWNYFWYPDRTIKPAELPPKVRSLGPEIERRVIDPLITAPLQKSKKAKPTLAAVAPPQKQRAAAAHVFISHNPALVLRRNGPATAPAKDNFDFNEWKKSHDDLTKEFGAESKTEAFKDAEGALLAARAQEHERQKTGVALPEVASSVKEESKALGKVEFWTGASSLPFGYLRRIFGTAFVKVAQLFIKVRDKFRSLLKGKSRTGEKSGLLGAALKAAFSVLKLAGAYVIGKTVDRLMESLTQGVTEKAKALFAFEITEDVQKKIDEVKKLQTDFEKKAVDTVEALLGKTVGPYIETLKQIEEVQRVVSDIVQIVNLVRWGARVVACLSPPGWGCLWILAQSVIEAMAAKAAETCWFKKKITPLISKVKFVADLPKDLADLIIDKIRGFLPEPVHDVFAKLDRSNVPVGEGDIECDEDDSQAPLTPEQQELMNMQEQLGEEKFQALQALAQKSGVPKDKPLSAADIKKLTEMIQSSGVTADQLKEYAENYPTAPQGMPGDIATFIDNVKSGGTQTPAGGTPPPTPPPQTPGSSQSADQKDTKPSDSGGGDIVVAEAKDRPFQKVGDTQVEGARVRVVNQSWSHTVGTTPDIDMMGFYNGKAVVLVKYIKSKVTKRVWFPKGSDEASASHLIVSYQLLQGVNFSPIPGGLPKDEITRAALEKQKS